MYLLALVCYMYQNSLARFVLSRFLQLITEHLRHDVRDSPTTFSWYHQQLPAGRCSCGGGCRVLVEGVRRNQVGGGGRPRIRLQMKLSSRLNHKTIVSNTDSFDSH